LPPGNVAQTRPSGGAFRDEVFNLVGDVAAILQQEHGLETQVAMWEDESSGCTVFLFASFRPSDSFDYRQRCEKTAADHLALGTCRTRGVVLLGWKERPIKPKPAAGFTAAVASIGRRRNECRRYYRIGKCYGCQKEHPTDIVVCAFEVVRLDSNLGASAHHFESRSARQEASASSRADDDNSARYSASDGAGSVKVEDMGIDTSLGQIPRDMASLAATCWANHFEADGSLRGAGANHVEVAPPSANNDSVTCEGLDFATSHTAA